jgi:hypothetical protein
MHIELHDLSHSRIFSVGKHFVFSAMNFLGQLHQTSRFFILASLSYRTAALNREVKD